MALTFGIASDLWSAGARRFTRPAGNINRMSAGSIDKVQISDVKVLGRVTDYVAITRLDHVTKHIFIIPGMVLVYLLRGIHAEAPIRSIVLGVIMSIAIASANYVINEWLDRDFDRLHPTKSQRSAVQRELHGNIVFIEWLALLGLGLSCAAAASLLMLGIACVFALQGVVYNVYPLRAKDLPYLDVVLESVNNPLRLMIGWAMLDPTTLAPGSIIVAYWLGGAYLMAAKRLSEYREIVVAHGKDLLVRYRASFAGYSETSLTASCFAYALLSISCLAIFLIKYRIEYILTLPLVVALFAHYLVLALRAGSSAQNPEKLFREHVLILLVMALTVVFALSSFVDMPFLEAFSTQHFIRLR